MSLYADFSHVLTVPLLSAFSTCVFGETFAGKRLGGDESLIGSLARIVAHVGVVEEDMLEIMFDSCDPEQQVVECELCGVV